MQTNVVNARITAAIRKDGVTHKASITLASGVGERIWCGGGNEHQYIVDI